MGPRPFTLLGLLMEALLAYLLYTWTIETQWGWVSVLAALVVVAQFGIYCWQLYRAMPQELQKLANAGNGVGLIVVAAWWWYLTRADDQETLIILGVIAALGAILMFDGLRIWLRGAPFFPTMFLWAALRVALGIWIMRWLETNGSESWGQLTVGITAFAGYGFALWCVASGSVRLMVTSGATRAILLRRQEALLREQLAKDQVYGNPTLNRD